MIEEKHSTNIKTSVRNLDRRHRFASMQNGRSVHTYDRFVSYNNKTWPPGQFFHVVTFDVLRGAKKCMRGAQAHAPAGTRSRKEKMVLCRSFADNR